MSHTTACVSRLTDWWNLVLQHLRMAGYLLSVVQSSRCESADGSDELVATERTSEELDLRPTVGRNAGDTCKKPSASLAVGDCQSPEAGQRMRPVLVHVYAFVKDKGGTHWCRMPFPPWGTRSQTPWRAFASCGASLHVRKHRLRPRYRPLVNARWVIDRAGHDRRGIQMPLGSGMIRRRVNTAGPACRRDPRQTAPASPATTRGGQGPQAWQTATQDLHCGRVATVPIRRLATAGGKEVGVGW